MKNVIYFISGICFIVFLGLTLPNKNNDIEHAYNPPVEYYDYIRKDENISVDTTDVVIEKKEVEQEKKVEVIPLPKGRWIWAKVTAYTAGKESCGIYADGKTSIGVKVTDAHGPDNIYGIAADPSVLPYGTKIYIPEYSKMLANNRTSKPSTKYETVDDTGSAMRSFCPHWRWVGGEKVLINFHLDIRVRQVSTARKWGVKYIQVYVCQ